METTVGENAVYSHIVEKMDVGRIYGILVSILRFTNGDCLDDYLVLRS
jgi:hypothetical protein